MPALKNRKSIPENPHSTDTLQIREKDTLQNCCTFQNENTLQNCDNVKPCTLKNAKDFDPKVVQKGQLTKDLVTEVYADVFEGLGKLPGEPYKLQVKDNAKPAMHRIRSVPVHLREAFEDEVKRLVEFFWTCINFLDRFWNDWRR